MLGADELGGIDAVLEESEVDVGDGELGFLEDFPV